MQGQTTFSFVMYDSLYYGEPGMEHILDGKVKNLTNDSLMYRWSVDSVDAPSDWSIQICDKNVCYAPGHPSAEFFLLGGEEGVMKPTIWAGTAYDATIWLTVSYVGDSTDAKQVEIHLNTLSASLDPLLEAGVSMQANVPNPFSAETMIGLELKGHSGQIQITDVLGREINTIPLSVNQSSVRIQADQLPSGLYFYTLWVEGRPLITHKMKVQSY